MDLCRFCGGLGVFAAACLPFAAAAQSHEQAAIVVTGGHTNAEQRPGGADSVSAEDYEDRLAVSLRDALAMSPGVYTQPRFGQEVRISIRGSGISRGFHMRGLTLLQDGIPFNQADDNGDFQELDPQIIERIDVYRGGNALALGGSTLGGAVNAITPTGRSAEGISARLDGGSFSTIRGKAMAGFADERGDALVALTFDRSDGDRAHADRSSVRFNGNAGLRLGGDAETRFHASVNHIVQDLPGSLTMAQALSTPEISLPNNIAQDQERDIDSIRLQSVTRVGFGAGAVEFGGYWNTKELFHPIFQVIDQKGNDRGVFARVTASGSNWQLSAGTQARFGSIRARQFVNVAGERGALTTDARQKARTINSYAEARFAPVEGLWLIAGGIHSSGWRKVDQRLNPARSGEASFDAFSPKIGLLWEPRSGVQFYANYNRSVELPGFSELNQTPFAVGGVVTPGFVPVDPQRAWTAEIGTRGSAGVVAWDVSLYRATIEGEMLQFDQGPGIPAATFNAGRTLHQGVEARVDVQPVTWARLSQTWLYSDFRFRGDAQFGNNRLPVVPRHFARTELRLGTERFSVTPRVEWVPQGVWADYRNTVRVPGYAMLGLGAEVEVLPKVAVFIDARNITGKRAVGDISATVAATPATVAFYPIERRALYLGTRARF